MRRPARDSPARGQRRSRNCVARGFAGSGVWVPVGAAAAAVFAALLLKGEIPGVQERPAGAAVALEDLEIVAGGEDFDMLREDEDFVAWAAEELADGVG